MIYEHDNNEIIHNETNEMNIMTKLGKLNKFIIISDIL